jgi:hypothetical protein
MGPKLTTNDLKQIDYLANTYHKNNYKKILDKDRPSLVYMESLYLTAINPNPTINVEYNNTIDLKELQIKQNRKAVDLLKYM